MSWRQLEWEQDPNAFVYRGAATSHFPTMARANGGTIYVLWKDQVGYGQTSNDARRDDVWGIAWNGSSTIDRSDVFCVSRAAQVGAKEDYNDWSYEPAMAADNDGWAHVIYQRYFPLAAGADTLPPPQKLEPVLMSEESLRAWWRRDSTSIAYATHYEEDAAEEWGWEYEISDAFGREHYPSIATTSDGSVHVLWTQYNMAGYPDSLNDNLDVAYRWGEALPDSVMPGEHMVWDQLVFLDQDFVVAATGTLEVAPGTTVLAQSNYDHRNLGNDSNLVELIVRGTLIAEGDSTAPIAFKSTKDSTSGEWHGIRFEDAGISGTADTSISSVEWAEFDAAVFPITVDSLSGNILDCSFTGSLSGDIYVDRDTRIPAGYQWNLKAPTNVVVNDTDTGANWWPNEEDSTRVEIFFEYSRLETKRPPGASSTDSVWFRSSSGVSDDWYGIGSWYSTMLIEDASLGHATHPLYFGVADSAWLRNSRVHNFHVEGVLDFWSDAAIEENVIDGSGADVDGRVGVHTEFSAGNIEGNTVTWDGAQGPKAIGVLVEFSKAHCDASVGQDTVRVVSNTFVGDGEDNQANSTGLKLLWGCEHRHPRVEENLVQEWSLRGMEIRQCAETRLTCNEVADNWRGVYYTRTNAAAGDTVRFYQNDLLRSNHRNFETDWAYGVMLHDEYADPTNERGKNYFQVDADTTLGSVNIYHSGPQTLDATKNKWITAAGATTTDSTTIASMIEIDGSGAVDHSTPLTNVLGTQSCAPAGAPLIAQRGEAVADSPAGDDAATPARLIPEALPMSFALRSSFPNPGRSQVEIGYDVPVGYVEEVVLAVFDVTGRRVKRLVSGQVPPGRHRAVWSGRDEAGVRVAAGVYFVRLEARDFRRTTKIVLIR